MSYHGRQTLFAECDAPGQAGCDQVQQRLALMIDPGPIGCVQKEFDQVKSSLRCPDHQRTLTETIPVVEDQASIDLLEEIAVGAEMIDRLSVVVF